MSKYIEIEIPTDKLQRIIGQEKAKEALIVAVAGEFSICFYGPVGNGKSLLIDALERIYNKGLNRKKPPPFMSITECIYPNRLEHGNYEIFAKVDKLNFGFIHKGFEGITVREAQSKIRKGIKFKENLSNTNILVEPTFWDVLGQSYSRDRLNPRKVFTALRVAQTMSYMKDSDIISREDWRTALKLVTFPSKKDKEKEVN